MALWLTTDERTELERRVHILKIRAEDARRARVILMLANGDSYTTIEAVRAIATTSIAGGAVSWPTGWTACGPGIATASVRAVHAVGRSRFRAEGRGRDRLVRQPA